MKTKNLNKEKLSGVSGGNGNDIENSTIPCDVYCCSCHKPCNEKPLPATEALHFKHKMEKDGCVLCGKKEHFEIVPVPR